MPDGGLAARPGSRDHSGLVPDLAVGGDQRLAQIGDPAALARMGPQGEIESRAERARKVAPLTAQGRQVGAEAPGPLSGGGYAHGIDPGEGLVENQGQRIEIRRDTGLAARRLLGRHVGQRPDHVAGHGQRVAADHASHAEVGQLGDLGRSGRPLGDEHVGGLDVTMDDSLVVGVCKRIAEGDPDLDDVPI